MWSDLLDRAWLYGGQTMQGRGDVANDIWRFERRGEEGKWTKLDFSDNATSLRPVRGAGCNAPDLQKGFYLGGIAKDSGNNTHYLHWLTVFDMKDESLSTLPVPEICPRGQPDIGLRRTQGSDAVPW